MRNDYSVSLQHWFPDDGNGGGAAFAENNWGFVEKIFRGRDYGVILW